MSDERRRLEQQATEAVKHYAEAWNRPRSMADEQREVLRIGKALIEYDSRPEWNVDDEGRQFGVKNTRTGVSTLWTYDRALRDRILAFLNSTKAER